MSDSSVSDGSYDPKTYAIRISEHAARDIDAAFLFTVEMIGEDLAREWRRGLLDTIATLATMPNRLPIPPEASKFKPPVVRQLVYRRTSNAPAWRVLFRVSESDSGGDLANVGIRAVLHGARRPLTRKESREIDSQG